MTTTELLSWIDDLVRVAQSEGAWYAADNDVYKELAQHLGEPDRQPPRNFV